MIRMFNPKKVIIVGVIAFILLLMKIEAFPGQGWERITEVPTKRVAFATAVVDHKIYLIGGTFFENAKRGSGGPYGVSTVEMYDPERNTWQQLADMPTRRSGAKAAVVDGIIYVFGGLNTEAKFANMRYPLLVEAYDPVNDTWIQKQDMPVSRIAFDIGVVAGKVYLMGGSTGLGAGDKERTDRVDVYDPALDIWMRDPKMPTRRNSMGAEVVNNRIYVIGGYGWPRVPNTNRPYLTAIEEYNPKRHQWAKKNDMLEVKGAFATVVFRDAIYLIGGWVQEADGIHTRVVATVDVYNPRKQTWSDIPPMLMPLRPFSAAAANGRIYVFGGAGEDREFFPDVMVYDTGFRAVEATGKLHTRWGELKAEHQN